jgi:hypothetical protein
MSKQATSIKAFLAVIIAWQVVALFSRASPRTPLTRTITDPALKQSPIHILPQKRRLAIASFVDGPEYLYGVFSTPTQMAKFNMSGSSAIEQVVIVPTTFPGQFKKPWEGLTSWMQGPDKHIYQVDRGFIMRKIRGGMWKQHFNKLWMFNMTDFDRIIVLDGDARLKQTAKWNETLVPWSLNRPTSTLIK